MTDLDPILRIYRQKLVDRGFTVFVDGRVMPPEGMGQMAVQDICKKLWEETEMEARGHSTAYPELKTHWHEYNPWADKAVYVPMIELAECLIHLDRTFAVHKEGDQERHITYTVQHALDHWAEYGEKLDCYILPNINGILLTAGVRYGAEGAEYLSPAFSLPKLRALLLKYQSKERAA